MGIVAASYDENGGKLHVRLRMIYFVFHIINYRMSTLKDCIEIASQIAIIIGTGVLVYSYRSEIMYKRTLNFQVMQSCIERYQSLIPVLNETPKKTDIEKYFDLVNEELFYIQRGYIDNGVAIEWIEGVLDYIPIYNLGNKPIWTDVKINTKEAIGLLERYSRLQNFTHLERDFMTIKVGLMFTKEDKRLIAKHLLKRVKKYKY